MALFQCPECTKEVSDKAKVCPGCGAPVESPASKEANAKTQKELKGCCGGFVLLAVIGIGIFAFFAYLDSPRQSAIQQQDHMRAWLVKNSKEAVTKQLKSPSTARFSNDDFAVSSDANGGYTVSSWVDSQNGFGATVRTKWTVVFKEVSGQTQVLSVKIE